MWWGWVLLVSLRLGVQSCGSGARDPRASGAGVCGVPVDVACECGGLVTLLWCMTWPLLVLVLVLGFGCAGV